MTERARWLMLVLTLIVGLGGGLTIALIWIADVDRDNQRDLCAMFRAFDAPDAPPPTTDRGRSQQRAFRDYLDKHC